MLEKNTKHFNKYHFVLSDKPIVCVCICLSAGYFDFILGNNQPYTLKKIELVLGPEEYRSNMSSHEQL